MKKILFVKDFDEKSLSYNLLKQIIPLQELDLDQIFSLQTTHNGQWLQNLTNYNISPEIIIENKIKYSNILNISNDNNIELIIVMTTSRPKTSIIKKLIKKSSIPILFVNKFKTAPDKNIFSHIVFATDWSQGSEKALNFLISFKKILGEMEIVNVINRKLTIKDMRELKERIAKTRKFCLNEKIDAEAHIYAGNTSDEILLAARDYKSTLIVLGSSSKEKTIKKYFKRSSSYIVTEKSNLPVLVIP